MIQRTKMKPPLEDYFKSCAEKFMIVLDSVQPGHQIQFCGAKKPILLPKCRDLPMLAHSLK